MYVPKQGDEGILFTGLSEYRNALEKDIPVLENAAKYSESIKALLDNHKKILKRVDEILEEI